MTLKGRHADARPAPAPDAEPDGAEVLDLDTRLGLSTFGSEQSDAPTTPTPRVPPLSGPTEEHSQQLPLPVSGEFVKHAAFSVPPPQPGSPSTSTLTPAPPAARRRLGVVALIAAVALAAILVGSLWLKRSQPPSVPTTGELTIDSTPAGARVIIGGQDCGTTPLALALAPGTYDIDLRHGDERHVVAVRVKAGATTAQHVFLAETAPSNSGTLRITSEPPAATVAVDGRRRGTTPVLITDIAPGAHQVVVTGTSGTVRQRVRVEPKATTTLMVPLPRSAPPQNTAGWLSITAPTELQVFDGGRLLGSTRVNPLMLPTGLHTLRLTNEAAGVDLTRHVTIERGHTARLQIRLAPGTLSVNALPWATVSVDGRIVGETPLGGLELSPELTRWSLPTPNSASAVSK